MRKRTFVTFGVLIVLLAVAVPFWAFAVDGSSESGGREIPADMEEAKTLFQTNCGNCHTLYAAETDGNFGPNLDETLAPTGPPAVDTDAGQEAIDGTSQRVLAAIENGFQGNDRGRMPAGILTGAQAEEVADFVAEVAGRG